MTALLAIVFFANITFAHSVDFHLCQGELQSVAFFGEKASCSKMMEAKMAAPRSCCDLKKEVSGLSFKPKSCCDNVQVVQDDILNKPSVDIDQTSLVAYDFVNNFEGVNVKLDQISFLTEKVEIPPPPNIYCQHTPENLQVFII